MSKAPTVLAYSITSKQALLSDGRWVKSRYSPPIGARVMIDKHGYIRPYGHIQSEDFVSSQRIVVGDDSLRRETGLRLGLSVNRSAYFQS